MHKLIVVISVLVLATLNASGQVDVRGVVVEAMTDEPIAGASVIVRDNAGKIKKYAATDANGNFSLPVTTVDGHTLDVSMMSYTKHTIALDSATLPLRIVMMPSETRLKEVVVKAESIREQGDTLTYNVGSFAQAQDRSIGDVLQRMPGIDVASNGRIQYQGEDINRFYIEGSDLLGGRYGIATEGISHDDVGAVEVLENHQPMQVLSGISFSNQAAINLKLKNKAKATWTFHGEAGGGYAEQPEGGIWDGEAFAMAVMPDFQSLTTFKTNSVGENLSATSTDFFASRRATDLSPYISIGLPSVPSLSERRTMFNRSALFSTNGLWKVRGGELKMQIDYSFNRVAARAANVTTYFLENGDRVVTESRDGRDRSHALAANFIYEVNQKSTYLNNTLATNLEWDDIRLGVTGTFANAQSAKLPDYYVSNKFKMIRRFGGKHLVTFNSDNQWESMPQTLRVSMDGNHLCQYVGGHAFYTHESTVYSLNLKGLLISLDGGLKGYLRSFNSDLTDLPEELPGATTNTIHTNSFTLYASPKLEYWVSRVNLVLTTPVSFAHYTFDKALANHSEGYFSPSVSANWKPNNRLQFTLRDSLGRSPMSLHLIQPGLVMTDYRTMSSGVDDFYNTTSHNVSAKFSYKHTRRGLFVNALVMQSWTHLPYTMSQQLYDDYVVYSYTDAKSDGKMLMASGSVSKTLDFMRGSMAINGSYNRSENNLMSESVETNSVYATWSIGGKISGSPLGWLSLDYKVNFSNSRLTLNGTGNSWLSTLQNELLVNLTPHPKWEWHVSGEHFRNEVAESRYKSVVLLDTKLIYKLNNRFELSVTVSNIFDKQTYNYTTYSQLSSFTSQRWLRGRETLISIILRK
ncbi:MAG: TonB-dependent receptor [Bacteroidales bacterium]|nr:TonB-dependent receptor [Bacteroidales bacterium]